MISVWANHFRLKHWEFGNYVGAFPSDAEERGAAFFHMGVPLPYRTPSVVGSFARVRCDSVTIGICLHISTLSLCVCDSYAFSVLRQHEPNVSCSVRARNQCTVPSVRCQLVVVSAAII